MQSRGSSRSLSKPTVERYSLRRSSCRPDKIDSSACSLSTVTDFNETRSNRDQISPTGMMERKLTTSSIAPAPSAGSAATPSQPCIVADVARIVVNHPMIGSWKDRPAHTCRHQYHASRQGNIRELGRIPKGPHSLEVGVDDHRPHRERNCRRPSKSRGTTRGCSTPRGRRGSFSATDSAKRSAIPLRWISRQKRQARRPKAGRRLQRPPIAMVTRKLPLATFDHEFVMRQRIAVRSEEQGQRKDQCHRAEIEHSLHSVHGNLRTELSVSPAARSGRAAPGRPSGRTEQLP